MLVPGFDPPPPPELPDVDAVAVGFNTGTVTVALKAVRMATRYVFEVGYVPFSRLVTDSYDVLRSEGAKFWKALLTS